MSYQGECFESCESIHSEFCAGSKGIDIFCILTGFETTLAARRCIGTQGVAPDQGQFLYLRNERSERLESGRYRNRYRPSSSVMLPRRHCLTPRTRQESFTIARRTSFRFGFALRATQCCAPDAFSPPGFITTIGINCTTFQVQTNPR